MSQGIAPALSVTTLERIIPVAKQCAEDDVAVTVTTLERYSAGFSINVRVDWVGPIGPMPHLVWRITTDRGGAFTAANCGGSGGGGRPGDYPTDAYPHSWRMHCYFGPAIDPEATTLTLELAAFRLSEPILKDGDPERFEGWKRARELTDLGQITIALL